MSTVTIDTLLLASVVTLAESRALEMELECAEARKRLDAEDSQINRNRFAEALAYAREASRVVRACDALLYPKAQKTVQGNYSNRIVFPHPVSEPAVEGAVTVLDMVET